MNSSYAGHHIAIDVDDIAPADALARRPGARKLLGPLPVTEGPAAGQSINYFGTPFGTYVELISYPARHGLRGDRRGGAVEPEGRGGKHRRAPKRRTSSMQAFAHTVRGHNGSHDDRRNPRAGRLAGGSRSIASQARVGIIAFRILGLLAGAIAKAISPGDDPGGFIITMALGVVGALSVASSPERSSTPIRSTSSSTSRRGSRQSSAR